MTDNERREQIFSMSIAEIRLALEKKLGFLPNWHSLDVVASLFPANYGVDWERIYDDAAYHVTSKYKNWVSVSDTGDELEDRTRLLYATYMYIEDHNIQPVHFTISK